jgi:hypothetical protein
MLTPHSHRRSKIETDELTEQSQEISVVEKNVMDWLVHARTASTEIKCEFHTHYHIRTKEPIISAELIQEISPLEKEFSERADRWEKQTGIYSSPTKKFLNEDYQIIMTMGKDVIPLILKRLQTKPNDWFWALKHFARKDVAFGIDNFNGAVQAWLDWGIKQGYISA